MLIMRPRMVSIRILASVFLCGLALAAGCNSVNGLLSNPDSSGNPPRSGLDGLLGGAPLFGAPSPAPSNDSSEIARTIEEADVVKVVGDKVYVLNRHKGLVIIDVASPDSPVVAGSLDVRGRGVEMYVLGSRAYVLLASDFYPIYYGDGIPPRAVDVAVATEGGAPGATAPSVAPSILPGPPPPDYVGSQVAIVDISNPAVPKFIDKLNLVGFANASRRVGDVIYVIGSNNSGYYYGVPEDQADEGFVASVNVADPDNAEPVQRKTFSGQGLFMHVSDSAIYAASHRWDNENARSVTRVQYLDITDPAGTIVVRDQVDVPGSIRNRFYMDDYAGALRIVTESNGFGFRTVDLHTYDITNPDDIQPLASVEVKRGESLEAVRFDGERGYAVTFLRIDPLFVLDLRDPADPKVVGQLEVPGYATHIEPRGDRLIAVGIDDTDGTRPAVAYYDVADPANPAELGRVVLGPPGSFTESDAVYDEKAFKIVDDLGLIIVPFRHVEYDYLPQPGSDDSVRSLLLPEDYRQPECMNGVQLVDFSDTALTQRGWFEHDGRVERVGQIGPRLFALSQVSFQTVNIDNRDDPAKAGQANLVQPSEMHYYDDCGYYFPGPLPVDPTPLPFPFNEDQINAVIDILVNGRLCGTITITPGLMLVGAIGLMKQGVRRRRR